ncbi:23S rRNA (adenine(2030)-N(6))-methyltransferase RlmJ [Motiliproteus sp. SC1-56]|uniref:23S rRNA (adenine(2030)-N(6))-methyltransferase RlmJ n=1 Tax=Motiliproteus sp. SC1-56 TaxID=2799565 RepID=UPI001A8DEB22
MLSYRHAFHAGNYADLLKHLIQIEILDYLGEKPKGFTYIDTHAGAGGYRLDSAQANKTEEYREGVGRWFGPTALKRKNWPELARYLERVEQFNPQARLTHYPGSPVIAANCLRPQDSAWLFELHPSDFPLLAERFKNNRRIRVSQQDGFQGVLGLLPCPSRRALVLIDPPYEQKGDYQKVVATVGKIHRKMANTIVALWYPVVQRAQINQLEKQLVDSGVRRVQLFELGVRQDSDGHGMTSAGMIVINPPWTLFAKMEQLLPRLAEALSQDGRPHWRCQQLVAE